MLILKFEVEPGMFAEVIDLDVLCWEVLPSCYNVVREEKKQAKQEAKEAGIQS